MTPNRPLTPRTRGVVLAALLASLAALAACSRTPEPAAGVVPERSDADVTTAVKTALLRDDSLKAFDITVVTLKGDVRLTGMVDSQAQIDAASALARGTAGAHSLHDELTLKPKP